MTSANVALVRSIYAAWERGDFTSADWAHPEIEYVLADGPDPGSWKGVSAMADATFKRLSAWEGYRFEVEDCRGLDHDRVLVLTRRSGRGKTSGMEVGQFGTKGAWLFHVLDGRVTRLVGYFDRERAFADLGLTGQAISQANVEVVKRVIAAVNERDLDGYLACCTEDIQLRTPWAAIDGVYEGKGAIRRFFTDLSDTGPDFRLITERLESIGADQVLAFLRVTVSGRASGIPAATDSPTANIYDFVEGKINRIRIFLDRQEALEAVGLSE